MSQLIADGEGATHVMIVDVEGAATEGDARRVAKAVADSPLVKTAVFGGDPNPGRFLQAVGAAGVVARPVAARRRDRRRAGGGRRRDPAGVLRARVPARRRGARRDEGAEIAVRVRLGDGPGSSRAYGCDLSYEYVRINGEYTT